jgi:parvulin-like peptidyl-prolyl isomerase
MKQLTLVAAAALLLSACGKQDAVPPAPTASASSGRPEKMPNGEPAVITIKHILIAFKDTGTKATRSRDEAEKLAYDLVGRAKSGEDFDKLMKEFSDDSPEGGTYTMVNDGLQPTGEEFARSGPRGMVKGFGDVGFRIQVGEIGVAVHHPTDSPYGWHIIKRIK